jgi:hypothetical protein
VAWPEWHLLKGIFQAVHGGDGSNLSHFCFFGWPFSRTCSRASGRGLVISGNALGRRLRCLGSIRPGLSPTRGFAMSSSDDEHPVGTVTAALVPADPDLHGEFGAELTRYLIGEQCGLRHQQSDQVVGEQVDPQRLARHLGATAAQGLYAEGSLDA